MMAVALHQKRCYSVAEAALELSISTASVRRLIEAGKIRTIRLGSSARGRVMIPAYVLDELIESH